jgi:acetylornithine deacetylase/succinyl-diaminopimelate desuccinylase-like protein
MHKPLETVLTRLDETRNEAVSRLSDLLRIPSISAQPEHAGDCARAANWLQSRLTQLGFAASVIATKGHPVVLATHPGPADAAARDLPRILFYGHYDVQPPEPLALWHNPPFEPRIIDGPNGKRLVARGAVDDKGQVALFLEALAAWHAATGGYPVPLTILLEGEEEIGSINLDSFLAGHKAALGADIVLISDTNMWDVNTPAITTSVRGMVYTEIGIHGPSKDLHSGMFGGVALNPINALTRILGELHDADGAVQIPGFYDGVAELSPARASAWHDLGFDEMAFLGRIGLDAPSGEKGRTALERLWSRPTADINGIWGGYTGPGAKTVIAASAHAKISFRLVPGQDPQAVLAGFRRFVESRLPPGARLEFTDFGASPGLEVPSESRFIAAAQAALEEEYGTKPLLMGCGGSIPVVASFKRLLGLDTILMGFGLDDDQIHSPNEKFDLTCFFHGARAHARLLARLGG